MSTTFDKKQIISSTELVRSFKKYENQLLLHDVFIFKHNAPEAVLMAYARYEKMRQKLEELEELIEHMDIFETIEQRKNSPAKTITMEKLQEKYAL